MLRGTMRDRAPLPLGPGLGADESGRLASFSPYYAAPGYLDIEGSIPDTPSKAARLRRDCALTLSK